MHQARPRTPRTVTGPPTQLPRAHAPIPRFATLLGLLCAAVCVSLLAPVSSFASGGPFFSPKNATTKFPVKFTANGAVTELHASDYVKCTGETASGTLLNSTEGELGITFTGCSISGLVKCSNAGAGEIKTKELKTLLAFTDPSKMTSEGRQTGWVLSPKSGEVFAEFTCSTEKFAAKIVEKGSVIGLLTPLTVDMKALTLTFNDTGKVQEPAEYETEGGGKVASALSCSENGGASEKCAIATSTPSAIELVTEGHEGVEQISIQNAGKKPVVQPTKGEFPLGYEYEGSFWADGSELNGPVHVKCTATVPSGSFTTGKEGKATITFTGCNVAGLVNCGNAGAGEIKTKELKVLVAYTPSKEIGLVFSPVSGEVFAEFNCGVSAKIVEKGSVVGLETPQSLGWLATFGFHATGTAQEPAEYEAEGGGKVASSLSCTLNTEKAEKCALKTEKDIVLKWTGEEEAFFV